MKDASGGRLSLCLEGNGRCGIPEGDLSAKRILHDFDQTEKPFSLATLSVLVMERVLCIPSMSDGSGADPSGTSGTLIEGCRAGCLRIADGTSTCDRVSDWATLERLFRRTFSPNISVLGALSFIPSILCKSPMMCCGSSPFSASGLTI